MPRINLLPWRAELRRQQKQEFMILLGVAAAAGMLIGVLVLFGFVQVINQQKARNSYLEIEIAKLDKKIEEIQLLRKKKEEFLARISAIEGLQTRRPKNVRLFDELVKAVPEGLSLVKLGLKDRTIELEGVAQSNARVSALMRNLDASNWMKEPSLSVIQASNKGASKKGEAQLLDFKVNVKQVETRLAGDEL